jgi:hypothetical protein
VYQYVFSLMGSPSFLSRAPQDLDLPTRSTGAVY